MKARLQVKHDSFTAALLFACISAYPQAASSVIGMR